MRPRNALKRGYFDEEFCSFSSRATASGDSGTGLLGGVDAADGDSQNNAMSSGIATLMPARSRASPSTASSSDYQSCQRITILSVRRNAADRGVHRRSHC